MTDVLPRRLGLADAVLLGVGAMVGAGVFVVAAPAAALAGPGLLLGLVLAGAVAYANATASARLAARYPTSGGTYVFGRERLGPGWGFVAGWAFVVGKTASMAAMALAASAHLVPTDWQRPVAAGSVLALTTVNLLGITRTARVTRVAVLVVLTVLAVAVGAALLGSEPDWTVITATTAGPREVLGSAGLIFFAFAGYARLATLGEEVVDPTRVLPRAIGLALGAAMVIYGVVLTTILVVLGPVATAESSAPLADAVAAGSPQLVPLVRLGAAVATLGALLGLLAGVSRTTLAMARYGDLPRRLAAVHHGVPRHAELAVAAAVLVTVFLGDLGSAIGFSSVGVLGYYLITHLAALTLPGGRRWLHVAGAAGCALLAVSLPLGAVLGATSLVGLGVAGRAVASRR